jgi:Ca-activated chloride channel family protein
MAAYLETTRTVRQTVVRAFVAAMMLGSTLGLAAAQSPPAFRSSIDLVRVTAIVRDHKGRLVMDLTMRDFEVIDGAERRAIMDFRRDVDGVSVALLFDISGSMEARIADAREAAGHILSWLDGGRDEAGVFTFDTRLVEVAPFTLGLKTVPESMAAVVPFGETSLRDAIAQAAERVGHRAGRRRAVAVLTDGNDTSSRLSAEAVAGIASAIDVPVYIIGVVASIDDPAADTATPSADRPWLAGSLDDLAVRTGGRVFVASTPGQRSAAARQIVDELRHQYLMAFESSGRPGWHPLVVRTRDRDLIVRARNGYIAGQSRPNTF